MENPLNEEQKRLQELADKSWNLELIISGAAIFLVSYLPGLLDQGLKYYLDNLSVDPTVRKDVLPILAYSFMQVAAWLLILAFVVHFIFRAFWVGLLGLHAVYPEGIRYDRLPMVSDLYKSAAAEQYGSLADYIRRIDRISNVTFSVAFLIALGGTGISLLYLIFFGFDTLVPVFFGEETAHLARKVLSYAFIALSLLLLGLQLASKSRYFLSKPLWVRMTKWGFKVMPRLLMPFIHRPFYSIYLVFSSNISKGKMYGAMGGGLTLVMAGVFYIFMVTLLEIREHHRLHTQRMFPRDSRSARVVHPRHYADQVDPASPFSPALLLPGELLEASALRVFVAYPKRLDEQIGSFCGPMASPDSAMSKAEKRAFTDSIRLDCLADYFRVSVNDSVYRPEWVFGERPGASAPGLVTYLPAAGFRVGKNVLKVHIPDSERPDSFALYQVAPFWYAPK